MAKWLIILMLLVCGFTYKGDYSDMDTIFLTVHYKDGYSKTEEINMIEKAKIYPMLDKDVMRIDISYGRPTDEQD